MNERDAVSGVSREQLEELITTLRQGDLLDGGKLTTLFSPDASTYPQEVGAAPRDEPLVTMEIRLDTDLCAVVSQDCDLRRLPDKEPYVVLAPMSQVSNEDYRTASAGLSARFFAYPPINDLKNLVLDLRAVMSVEKIALTSQYVRRTPCPLDTPTRADLREWLGRRFGRVAYPDEIEDLVVKPIMQAIKRTREKDAHDVFRSFVYYGLRYMPGNAYVSLLILFDPARIAKLGVNEDEFKMNCERFGKALDRWTKNGPYSVILNIHSMHERPATDILEHEALAIEIDSFDLDS